jgi:hypothetical protein
VAGRGATALRPSVFVEAEEDHRHALYSRRYERANVRRVRVETQLKEHEEKVGKKRGEVSH